MGDEFYTNSGKMHGQKSLNTTPPVDLGKATVNANNGDGDGTMVRLTKIYTRTGDGGQTHLAGGQRVPKDSLRIDAYGTVDELNSVIGLVRSASEALPDPSALGGLSDWLRVLQSTLFNLGSDLSTLNADQRVGQPLVSSQDVSDLEQLMDRLNNDLEPLKSFVLPGGSAPASHLHLARTVCRRAERCVIALSRNEPVGEFVIQYLNRLSDALFVWSRWVCHQLGQPEPLWEPAT
jgi:cob(I)alamin adenosyltransferase